MITTSGVRAVAVALVAAAMLAPPAMAAGILRSMSLSRAMSQHEDTGGFLVVMATAEWCGPCRTMKRTTWTNSRVEAWFEQRGMAAAIDGDRHRSDMQTLRVRAYPTLIAFYNGREVARVSGGLPAGPFLDWLNSAWDRAGAELPAPGDDAAPGADPAPEHPEATPTPAPPPQRVATRDAFPEAPDEPLPAELEALRVEAARGGVLEVRTFVIALLDAGNERYAAEVAIGGLERGYGCSLLFAEPLGALAERDVSRAVLSDAAERFDARSGLGSDCSAADASTWFALNSALGLQSTNRRWVVTELYQRPIEERAEGLTGPMLVALADAGRWDRAARLIEDAELFGSSACSDSARTLASVWPTPLGDESACMLIAWAYASCLAADRDEDAAMLAQIAVDELEMPEDEVRRRLAEMASVAGVSRPMHADWIESPASP